MAKQRRRISVTPSSQKPTQKEVSKEKLKEIREKRAQEKKEALEKEQKVGGIAVPWETLWKEWKEIFLCGTEWANMDQVHNNPWNFNNLKKYVRKPELFKEFGVENFSRVLLFGSTEAQSLPDGTVVLVPYILAVVGNMSLPEFVGVTSVQRVGESIVPMEEFRLTWARQNVEFGTRRSKKTQPEVYIMECYKRPEVVKHMKEEDVVEFNYVIPYILAPRVTLKDEDPPTSISVRLDDFHGKGVQLDFDWEVDQLKPYVQDLCETYSFSFDEVGKELRDIILAEKQKVLDQFNEEQKQRKQRFYDLPAKEQESLQNAKFIKFYPENPEIEAFKNPIINRYYGKADVVV